jgi:WhiB family transcriptional regulator, redox-sensing transcriptional regulator
MTEPDLAYTWHYSPPEPDDWMAAAVCRQVDPTLFHPDGNPCRAVVQARLAKSVCASCPVAVECLEFALEHDERHGIWGGTDERERRELWRAS